MKPGLRLLGAWCLPWFLCLSATAQSLDYNQLCIHNGGEYWVQGIDHSDPEMGGGKYYPSFAHWAAEGMGTSPDFTWPWRIRGWAWTGMQTGR